MSVRNGVWHDVRLDPPRREGSYLVATDRGGVALSHWYMPNEWSKGQGHFNGYHGHITHWMEKPEPPSAAEGLNAKSVDVDGIERTGGQEDVQGTD